MTNIFRFIKYFFSIYILFSALFFVCYSRTLYLMSVLFEGILPDSPPDSGSEHCQLSPHYALSPPDLEPGHGDAVDTVANITLYNDPVLFQGQSHHTILTSQIETHWLQCVVIGFD